MVLEVFVQKLAKLGRRWACRSMSLGMSQHVAAIFVRVVGHVAACRSTFGISRRACRSMSCHFWACCDTSLGPGRISGQNLRFSGLASAPPCFSDSPRAHKRPEASVFCCQKGNWAEGGGFYIATRVKRFFGSGTVTPGPSCKSDITFLLMGGQNLGNNCVTVR